MHSSDPNTNIMLGFGRTVSHSRKGRACLRIVRVWANGFAKREGKTEGRGRTWWCSSPAKGPK
jgi:hypothetical protein